MEINNSLSELTTKENMKESMDYNQSMLTEDDVYLFNEGNHFHLYEKLGAHGMSIDNKTGTCFAVWAPDAENVSVIGDFNGWNRESHPLRPRGQSGIWEGFIPGVGKGELYKYYIKSRYRGYQVEKTDPFAFYYELPPKTASVVWDLEYQWRDEAWMTGRASKNAANSPLAIYEVHLGSWMRAPDEDYCPLTYRELALKLVEYVRDMGFTHVEFLPVMEHPFYGSWGYQCLGYFATTSRYGTPQDFMFLIDSLHRHNIGIILDWVPSHFPNDEYGLGFFDGTHLFEHADPREGFHPEWESLIFNYGRDEVRSFLISSALFWLDKYHADGLRVQYGGKENIAAMDFLRRLNEAVYKNHPDVQTIAEESTSWAMVSRPTYVGGLGFGMKWDMGWMHDTLEYISRDPIYRKYHHNKLTFRMLYAFHENFLLPLSHDEVVHGKGSLLRKMPGDDWQKFANMRLLFGYMYAQPGKKLLFMGGEFGQWDEWYHEASLDWHLLDHAPHAGLQLWVKDLNNLYRKVPALHELDFDPAGFEWIDCDDTLQSTFSMVRKGRSNRNTMLIVCNFTPLPRYNYRVGVPLAGYWREVLNSDGAVYGGGGIGNLGGTGTEPIAFHGRPYSLDLTLPPLAAVYFRYEGAGPKD
jgi:1,4-alpha-glucan branching enzyme